MNDISGVKKDKIYKIRVRYATLGHTHKSSLEAFRAAVLNSGLPYRPAKINKHWPHAAFGPAVEDGTDSHCQYADIYFDEKIKAQDVLSLLKKQENEGIKFIEVKAVPYVFPSVESLAYASEYTVEFKDAAAAEKLLKTLESKKIDFSFTHSNGMTETLDLKRFLVSVHLKTEVKIELILRNTPPGINALQAILAKCLGSPDGNARYVMQKDKINIIKQNLYWQDSLGGLQPV